MYAVFDDADVVAPGREFTNELDEKGGLADFGAAAHRDDGSEVVGLHMCLVLLAKRVIAR
jgi:hypothetical protein